MKTNSKTQKSNSKTNVNTYENQSNANKSDAASGGMPMAVSRMMIVTREPLGMDGTAKDINVTSNL